MGLPSNSRYQHWEKNCVESNTSLQSCIDQYWVGYYDVKPCDLSGAGLSTSLHRTMYTTGRCRQNTCRSQSSPCPTKLHVLNSWQNDGCSETRTTPCCTRCAQAYMHVHTVWTWKCATANIFPHNKMEKPSLITVTVHLKTTSRLRCHGNKSDAQIVWWAEKGRGGDKPMDFVWFSTKKLSVSFSSLFVFSSWSKELHFRCAHRSCCRYLNTLEQFKKTFSPRILTGW